MKAFVYKKWDGSQEPFSLKRKEIVDQFMENIMKGMSPNMSFLQMMWEGFPLAGMNFRVMGLSDMVDMLEDMKEELMSKYSLDKAFDKPMEDLKYLLDEEAMTRRINGAKDSPSYESLPPGLLEKMNDLKNFQFMNSDSKELLDQWERRRQDIMDLYEFYSQYASQFTGDNFLDFEEAVELMRQFDDLDNLQQMLMSGQLPKIDPETLRQMLGEDAEKSLNILMQLPKMMAEEGIVKVEQTGLNMTPRGIRALGEMAFGRTIDHLKKDRQGRHLGNAPQSGEIEPDSSRPYEYGDRFDLDITKTILNSLSRQTGIGSKITLMPDDLHVREREQLITTTTVVLLDMSWSMVWDGRFEAGKKVALALDHYIRTRFPKDKVHIIGFSTEARELKGNDLALAVWDDEEPFTNLQGGLRLAMSLIKKSGNRNNKVIVITDGQPTAYYIDGKLHVEFPGGIYEISPNACKATLAEVRKVTAQGMNIETFVLDDNPVLVEFTRQIARINKGRAIMCLPQDLGRLVVIEEVKRRGGKV